MPESESSVFKMHATKGIAGGGWGKEGSVLTVAQAASSRKMSAELED